MPDDFLLRVHGNTSLPTLIYLPGLHGDWTLVSSFRAAMAGRARFVEFTYSTRTDLSLAGYAAAVEAALLRQGIHSGWLLGESFGSQVAWALLKRQAGGGQSAIHWQGLILAGGFVRHPWPWGARLLKLQARVTPGWLNATLFRIYQRYALLRHREAKETLEAIGQFVTNRLAPGDAAAIEARLELIATNDPRPVARQATLPVHYLAGAVDPLVPWPWVCRWLRQHCPGYHGAVTFWNADHGVLATRPRRAADQVLAWVQGGKPATSIPSAAPTARLAKP